MKRERERRLKINPVQIVAKGPMNFLTWYKEQHFGTFEKLKNVDFGHLFMLNKKTLKK